MNRADQPNFKRRGSHFLLHSFPPWWVCHPGSSFSCIRAPSHPRCFVLLSPSLDFMTLSKISSWVSIYICDPWSKFPLRLLIVLVLLLPVLVLFTQLHTPAPWPSVFLLRPLHLPGPLWASQSSSTTPVQSYLSNSKAFFVSLPLKVTEVVFAFAISILPLR